MLKADTPRYKAGMKEISILSKLKELDPDDKKHVIRMEDTFEFNNHLCIVFENLQYASSFFVRIMVTRD